MVAPRPAVQRARVRLPQRSLSHDLGDPIVVGLVSLLVYVLHGFHGYLDRDLGMFVYGGEHVARGTPPYVAMFNSVGPLADAVPGLAIWVGHFVGVGPIMSARVLFVVLAAACCALVGVLARDAFGSRAAGFMAAAVFLTFQDFLNLASDGPREKTTMVLLVLACLILLGRRRWLAAGVCAALATLTWQPALFVAAAALVAAALVDQRGRLRHAVGRFVAGGVGVSVVAVAYFVAAGALPQALDGFVVINVRYTHQPSPLSDLSGTWSILWTAYRASLLLVIGGIVAVVVLGLRAVPAARGPALSPAPRRLLVVGSGGVAGTLWTLKAMNGAPDLFILLPFAAIGLAVTALVLLSHLPRRLALTGTVALVCLGLGAATVESVSTRDYRLDAQRADTLAVLGSQPPDAVVLSLNAPQVLAISGRTDPNPYQYFSSSVQHYLDGTYPGGMEGFIQDLQRERPTIVAVGTTLRGLWPYGWLTRDYVRIGTGVGVNWYIARSAGPAAIARAQLAHGQVMLRYRH